MLGNTRTDTNTYSTKVRSKRCECLFNTGVLVILLILVSDTKMRYAANTPVLAEAPAIHKALAEIGVSSDKSVPLAGQECLALPAQHVTEHIVPQSPAGPKPTQATCCVPLAAHGKAIQTKASSWKGKLLPPPGQRSTEKFAIPPSHGTFQRAESCPSPVIQCRNNDFTSEFRGNMSHGWL